VGQHKDSGLAVPRFASWSPRCSGQPRSSCGRPPAGSQAPRWRGPPVKDRHPAAPAQVHAGYPPGRDSSAFGHRSGNSIERYDGKAG